MTSKALEKRTRNKPTPPDRFCRQQSQHSQHSQRSQIPAQSRIQAYITGKIPLDQMVNKDRLIKPEDRHNKRAFLPRINDDVKIVPRKSVKSKTIQVKVPTALAAPSQNRSKTKIKEYDETTRTFRTPQPATRSKQKPAFNIDLKDYHLVIKNNGTNSQTAAIEFKYQENSPHDENTSNTTHTPSPFSSQSPGNEIVPVISNVNLIPAPDKIYYEETLGTKNDEITMLKEKVRKLQTKLISKSNHFSQDQENVVDKIIQSLEIVTNEVKNLKNTQDQAKISQHLATIEEHQDKWYSYAETISATLNYLKEANLHLKNDNDIKQAQLDEEHFENERLQKELITLKTENSNLIKEKNHFVDSLSSVKHSLKVAVKDNEYLRNQTEDYKRLNEKAIDQLNMLNEACKRVQVELQDKEKESIETGAQLRHQIEILEAANQDLANKYERVSEQVIIIGESCRKNAALAQEVESRNRNEIETAVRAKQQYIDSLQTETFRLKDEILTLEDNLQKVTSKNEQNYSIINQLTNEINMLREDTKNMVQEREQLKEGIAEWCKHEIIDSVQLIAMMDKLKMKTIVAETNYTNRLMEDLAQTIKFTRVLDE